MFRIQNINPLQAPLLSDDLRTDRSSSSSGHAAAHPQPDIGAPLQQNSNEKLAGQPAFDPRGEQPEHRIEIPKTAMTYEDLRSTEMAGAMKERKRWFANPKFALTCGMLEISILIYVLVSFGVVEGEFFRFGPPIQLFKFEITGNREFACILIIFFIHQCMFTWLNEVVSPWILNEIQDPQNRILTFPKSQTLFFINIYYVYFTLNSVMLVNVSLSQLSFLVMMLLADFIATTTLNLYYIWNKKHYTDSVVSAEKGILDDCGQELKDLAK